jgi:hypothetical protein
MPDNIPHHQFPATDESVETLGTKLDLLHADLGTLGALGTPPPETIATAQVSVADTAGGTLIAAARAGRKSITIVNEGSTLVRLGPTGVTTSTGLFLKGAAGESVKIDGGAAIYGIVATGTQAVSYVEVY